MRLMPVVYDFASSSTFKKLALLEFGNYIILNIIVAEVVELVDTHV